MSTQPFITDNDAAAMRDLLAEDYLDDTFLRNNFLNWVPKEGSNDGGKQVQQVLKTGATTQHGANDVAGLAGVSGAGPQRQAFFTPWIASYGFAQVPMTDIILSQSRDTSVVELLVDAVRDARKSCARDLEKAAAGDGFGTITTISATSGSYVLTAAQVSDCININLNDTFVTSAANNSSSLDTGSIQVTAVDRDAGTFTVTASGGWTPTVGHYVFNTLDKISGAYATPYKIFGLSAWIPSAYSGTTRSALSTLGGVTRTTDPQNLGGVWGLGSARAIRASVNSIIAKIMPKADANPDALWMSPNTLMALKNELNNQFRYVDMVDDVEVNAEAIQFDTTNGKAKAMESFGIPDNLIYVLTRDTWKLRSPVGMELVQAATNNGKDFVDSYNSVQAQIRQMSLCNLSCAFPGANGVCVLS